MISLYDADAGPDFDDLSDEELAEAFTEYLIDTGTVYDHMIDGINGKPPTRQDMIDLLREYYA